MDNQEVVKALSNLYRIVEAGEKGFTTAATNAHNRGIKVLFKSFAQQRTEFKEELRAELRRLGEEDTPRSSILGAIHRGRVAIFSAMTIEDRNRERVVVKESAFGERIAVREYEKTLAKDLPPDIRQMVERQAGEIRKVAEQVHLMRGQEGRRLVLRLFENERQAERAVQSLNSAGFSEGVEKITVSENIERSGGKGITAVETLLSGAFGGLLWGALIGVLAGVGAVQTTLPQQVGLPMGLAAFVVIAIGITILGALGGGILGFIIGVGVSEDDNYEFSRNQHDGMVLVKAMLNEAHAMQAEQLLDQLHLQAGDAPIKATA